MGYAEHVLQAGESIAHRSKVHWIGYIPGALCVAVAIAVILYANPSYDSDRGRFIWWGGLAAIIGIFGLYHLLKVWFKRWTTEIVVTNKRIIYKSGFISRSTVEMNLDKVESVQVEQTVFGRILDYGTIIIRGTGAGIEPIRMVEGPLEFRSHVTAR
jgi:uncharacterized membrane protein YdbT with pleckstrin-like domain